MLYNPQWKKPAYIKPLEEWQRILFQAADLIDHLGLAQHTLEDLDGRLCLTGAMMTAGRNGVLHSYLKDDADLGKAINAMQARHNLSMVGWNNEPGRTDEEVVKDLREAAWTS